MGLDLTLHRGGCNVVIMEKLCRTEDCANTEELVSGWCPKHYTLWRLKGDHLDSGNRSKTTEERFWSKVAKSSGGLGCWLWMGATQNSGHGVFWYGRKRIGAHRASYLMFVDNNIEGLDVDHKYSSLGCPKNCVNPEHLHAVTRKQNNENLGTVRKNNLSGFRGVSWDKQHRKWVGQVSINKRRSRVGLYPLYEIHVAAYYVSKARESLYTNSVMDKK